MRARALRGVWLLSSSALVFACSLASLDGLSDGTGSPDGGDAIAPADVASGTDGTTTTTDASSDAPGTSGDSGGPDATSSDASDASDAATGSDATADADAGPALRFCQKAPANAFFCNDFDTDPYLAGWTPDGTGFGPTLFYSTSPPRSLAVSLPSRGPGQPYGALHRRVPAGPLEVSLAFDLRIDDSSQQEAVDLGSVYLDSSPYWSANFRYNHPNPASHILTFFEYGDAFDAAPQLVHFNPLGPPPKLGDFFHVVMTVKIGPSSSTVRIDVDGVSYPFAASGHLFQSPNLAVSVGVTGSDGSGAAFQGAVDNVLVTPALP